MTTQVIEKSAETKKQKPTQVIWARSEFQTVDLESLDVGDSQEIKADLNPEIDDLRLDVPTAAYLLRRVFSAAFNLALKANDWLSAPPQTHRDKQNTNVAIAHPWTRYS